MHIIVSCLRLATWGQSVPVIASMGRAPHRACGLRIYYMACVNRLGRARCLSLKGEYRGGIPLCRGFQGVSPCLRQIPSWAGGRERQHPQAGDSPRRARRGSDSAGGSARIWRCHISLTSPALALLSWPHDDITRLAGHGHPRSQSTKTALFRFARKTFSPNNGQSKPPGVSRPPAPGGRGAVATAPSSPPDASHLPDSAASRSSPPAATPSHRPARRAPSPPASPPARRGPPRP